MTTYLSTDPRQLAVDATTGDLQLVNGKFAWTTGLDAIAQDIVIRLRLFVGEWFLDLDAGTDWWSYLGEKFTSSRESAMHAEMTNVVLAVAGVTAVSNISLALDATTRVLAINLSASSTFGDITIATEVTA